MDIFRLTPAADGNVAWPTLSTSKKSVVTVGAFDGLHVGHHAVIEATVRQARKLDAYSVVIMFDPRPAFVHAYAKAHAGKDVPAGVHDPEAITGVDARLRMLSRMHVDYVLIVRYTIAFSEKSFRFFLGQLVGKLGMRMLVLGEDARMGANLEGALKKIRTLAEATGVFELEVVTNQGGTVRVPERFTPTAPNEPGEPGDPLEGLGKAERRAWSKKHNAREVRNQSSTNVRYLLSQGRVQAANEILGHAHAVEGVVEHGEERGRTIGFPTANIAEPMEGYLPVDGVYAGWLVDLGPADEYERDQQQLSGKAADGEAVEAASVTVSDTPVVSHRFSSSRVDSRLAAQSPFRWPAAISIGTKPTYSESTGLNERVLEAYALTDEWLDLYGHRVRVEFERFLRPQIKFGSTDELVAELKHNVEETKELLGAE